jgi:IS5 family transposase
MGYKQIGENLSFADLAVSKTLDQNRSLKMMEKINGSIDWENVEALLLKHYRVGRSKEGADAFSPLLLMKCMLLQKWFRIPSDPELENQINDRMCGRARSHILAGGKPAPEGWPATG